MAEEQRTAPQTFEDSSKTAIVHLVGAVKDNHKLAETASHVLYCLRLSCTSWACWSASQGHSQCL